MKRPVFLLFTGLVLGEAAAILLNRTGFFVMALFLFIFILILYKVIKKKQGHFFIFTLLFFCFFFIGGISFYRAEYLDELDRMLSKKELKGILTGQIEFVKQSSKEEYQITIKEVFLSGEQISENLKKTDKDVVVSHKRVSGKKHNKQYKIRGKCRILKLPVSAGKVYPGDWITCTGKLRAIEDPANPGQFDSKLYEYSMGIRYHFIGDTIHRSKESPFSVYRTAGIAREQIAAAYLRIVPEAENGLLKAIFLGDKTDLSKEYKNLYQDCGMAHLLAVSGLHISIIGGMLFQFLRKRGCGYALSCVMGSTLLVFYAVMTGFGNSVFRAAIMFLCYLLSQYYGAEYDIVSSMSMAGILMLLDCPWRLLESGCILSFAAIGSIGLICPFVQNLEEKRKRKKLTKGEFLLEGKWKKKIGKAFFANLIFTMTITPLLLRFYYQWSPYSILLNLLMIPAMSPLLLSAIVGGIFGICNQFIGFLGCIPAVVLLKGFDSLFRFVLKLPFAVIVTGCLPWWQIFVIYLLEICFFIFWYRRLWEGSIFLCLLLAAGSFFCPIPPFRMIMLDVGQGECIFMKMPTGETVLIDGGSTSKKNVADSIIIPALKYYGENHLDYVIITHTDEDHISGIRELLEQNYPIKNVIFSATGKVKKDNIYADKREKAYNDSNDIMDIARQKGYSVLKMSKGDRMNFNRIHFRCLHPQKGWINEDVNSSSIVLHLTYGDFSMLFTGDLNGEQEALLSMEKQDIGISAKDKVNLKPVTVLKIAHHGSKNSTTEQFLKEFCPKQAILSAGKNNLYGHPHRQTLSRLKKSGTTIYGTLWGGAILIWSDGAKYQIKYFKK